MLGIDRFMGDRWRRTELVLLVGIRVRVSACIPSVLNKHYLINCISFTRRVHTAGIQGVSCDNTSL